MPEAQKKIDEARDATFERLRQEEIVGDRADLITKIAIAKAEVLSQIDFKIKQSAFKL